MKNTFFLLALLCTSLILVTSCSEETFGTEFELVSPEDLKFAPGDTATFTIKVTNESGIDQINILEETIPYSQSILYRPLESDVEETFSIAIPESQADGSKLSIGIGIVNSQGNIIEKIIEVKIEE